MDTNVTGTSYSDTSPDIQMQTAVDWLPRGMHGRCGQA